MLIFHQPVVSKGIKLALDREIVFLQSKRDVHVLKHEARVQILDIMRQYGFKMVVNGYDIPNKSSHVAYEMIGWGSDVFKKLQNDPTMLAQVI